MIHYVNAVKVFFTIINVSKIYGSRHSVEDPRPFLTGFGSKKPSRSDKMFVFLTRSRSKYIFNLAKIIFKFFYNYYFFFRPRGIFVQYFSCAGVVSGTRTRPYEILIYLHRIHSESVMQKLLVSFCATICCNLPYITPD